LCSVCHYDQYIYKKLGHYDKAVEGGAIMKKRIFVIALLALSCLMFILPIAASFPAAHHDGQQVSLDFSNSVLVQASMVHPNDPGSGGGGTGVIT